MLWHTNPHLSVDRLFLCISGNEVISSAQAVNTRKPLKKVRVTHLLILCGINTKSGSSVPIQLPSLLSSVGRAVDS
ncbi:hypothetical protein F3148_01155 [Streptococcus agalactiae]|nr:hypothetical protein F3148_01155 [Streptococcus agalactiae]